LAAGGVYDEVGYFKSRIADALFHQPLANGNLATIDIRRQFPDITFKQGITALRSFMDEANLLGAWCPSHRQLFKAVDERSRQDLEWLDASWQGRCIMHHGSKPLETALSEELGYGGDLAWARLPQLGCVKRNVRPAEAFRLHSAPRRPELDVEM
jgi:hypothetical protein